MGDGGLDVDYVSFIVCRLRQRIFGICLWYMFWYMFGDVLVYVHMFMDVSTAMSYVIKLQ